MQAWGGERLLAQVDRPTEAWIVIALHSSRLGPATGGTRLMPYASFHAALRDALQLSAMMTWKFALADFPRGGGKAVLGLTRPLSSAERAGLLQRYGRIVHELGGRYQAGPDVGTGPADMDIVAQTAGPWVFSRTPQQGGAGDSAWATALGVLSAMQAVAEELFGEPSLRGRSVLVQGAGSVGSQLIELLLEAGARAAFADIDAVAVDLWRRRRGVTFVAPDAVPDFACDILAPCALGGTLNAQTIPRLRCRAIAGAANNQLAQPSDAQSLRQRGILYAPDFAINSGGAVAITGMEALGWSAEQAQQRVRGIATTLRAVLARARAEDIDPHEAAMRQARERLAAAGAHGKR